MATLPVLAVRKLPVDKVIQQSPGGMDRQWMVSDAAAVASALSSDQMSDAIKTEFSGPPKTELAPSQMKAMGKAVDVWTKEFVKNGKGSYQDLLTDQHDGTIESLERTASRIPRVQPQKAGEETSMIFPDGSVEQLDREAVGRILATNGILMNDVNRPTDSSKLVLNAGFAQDIIAAYYPFKMVLNSNDGLDALYATTSAVKRASLNSSVAVTLLVNQGDAGFGLPIAFTSKEKSLKIPPPWPIGTMCIG